MYDLPQIGLTEVKDFSLFIRLYENSMDEQMGVKLSRVSPGHVDNDDAVSICRKYVTSFNRRGDLKPDVKNHLSDVYKTITYPCSLNLDDEVELETMVLDAYRLSYMHYILGCETYIKKEFPKVSCGISSCNLLYSLMKLGYPNALRVRNSKYDHDYVILPFICKNQNGVVLVDPTSDQLWKKHDYRPRNVVSVHLGDTWFYITDWEDMADLYPTQVEYFPEIVKVDVDLSQFLGQAFSNAIKVKEIDRMFADFNSMQDA